MATDLASRLDRFEGELRRLEKELEEMRSLVVEEGAPEPEPLPAIEVAPAPPPFLPPPAPAPPKPVEKPPAPVAPAPVAARPAPVTPPPAPTEPGARARPPAARRVPRRPAAPPAAPRRSLRQLAEDWDLTGPRGFAIVGGAVLALGIGFFFVLAANRGWIDERARVALGAAASALALAAGLLLRARYGQYWAALGAVGAGIAGAYATLAAATARYDLVPDALGLPIAGLIAAVGTAIAIRWHSQVIAAIGLLGAALAPALQALDTGIAWESVAFALIVMAAAAAVSIPRAWSYLLYATTAVVAVQGLWLVREVGVPADDGTIAVTAALAAVLLAIAVGLQLVSTRTDLEPLALTYALFAIGVPFFATARLFDERADRGLALVGVSAIWVAALAVLAWRRKPDLALVVGASALALTAVGSALLLSDAALTVAWAVEAVLLAVLAARFADARLEVTAIVYAALASAYALGSDAVPGRLFDAGADHGAAVLPLAVSAIALAVAGSAARASYAPRTETGLLAFLESVRTDLERHRQGIRETLVFTGAGFATLSASFALVSQSFEWGHVAATALAAAVGAVILASAGVLRSDGLAAAAYLWLGVVLVVALGYDLPEFYVDATETSSGGWAALAAAAGLLGGAYAHRLPWSGDRIRDVVAGIAFAVAAAAAALGVGFVSETRAPAGIGLLLEAGAYAGLAAWVFRRPGLRDVATTLWSLALVALIGAEALLVTDSAWLAAVVAATAVAVAALASPLREERLWLAGGALAVATTGIVLLVQVQPWLEAAELSRRLAIATAAGTLSTFAVAALRWAEVRWRDLVTVLWAAGILALLATERVLLGDVRATAIAFALTGGALALLAHPLREERVWTAGATVVGITLVVTLVEWTPPSHLFVASEAPGDGLWVLVACLLGLAAAAATCHDLQTRVVLEVVAGGVALYGLSLGILEIAERVSSASIETDFERGHTAVSGLWALVGLALLVVGLLRGSTAIRYGGLALFALSVAKIFLYDLSSLSSVARAFSFILVGGLLLVGGFFLQRLSDRLGPPKHP